MKERVKKIKEEMNSGERVYKDVVTIGDMEAQGFMPLDFFKSEEFENMKQMPIKFNDWDFFLKIMNAALVKGADFSRNTPWMEFLTEMGSAIESVFLLKSSEKEFKNNSPNE